MLRHEKREKKQELNVTSDQLYIRTKQYLKMVQTAYRFIA